MTERRLTASRVLKWTLLILGLAFVAAAVYVVVLVMLNQPDGPLGNIPADLRRFARELWAAMTNQSPSDDLFP